MTPQEKQEYKNKVSIALKAYVIQNKLETVSREIIMQHMQNMYRHLETLGLIQYGLNYASFIGFAQQAFMFAEVQDHFN